MSYMNAQPHDAQGVYKATMTGPMMAYITFAYDLFTVQDNGRLDARLIERLKNAINSKAQGMSFSQRLPASGQAFYRT